MGWTINGYVPDEPKAKLIPSTKKNSNVPVSPGWAAARQEQLNARTSGRQIAPNVSTPSAPKAGMMNGPAYGGSAPMGLRDWQQMTGVYDAPVDSKRDTWTPTGFGVPGVPRGDIDGLQDFYGRNIGENGVVDSIKVSPVDEVRTNGNGVVSAGKNLSPSTPIDMGRSFDSLLEAQGNKPYSSNQLPTTGANPFSAIQPQTTGFPTDVPDIGGYNGATYDSKEGAEAAGSRDISQFAPMTGNEQRIKGGSDRKAGGSLDEALADKAGINSYMKKFSGGSRERAARSAFLNAEDSLSGLQARDAVNDVVYAGGQHYGRGALSEDSGLGDKYKIDRADARDIASGNQTAAGLLESYKSRITEASKESTPAEQQEPTVLQNGAKNQAFKQDTPIASQMPSDIGGKTEYYSNNDNVDTSFGQPKGFKSGFKRIDTSMKSPFG